MQGKCQARQTVGTYAEEWIISGRELGADGQDAGTASAGERAGVGRNGRTSAGELETNGLVLTKQRVAFTKPTGCFSQTNPLVSRPAADASPSVCPSPPVPLDRSTRPDGHQSPRSSVQKPAPVGRNGRFAALHRDKAGAGAGLAPVGNGGQSPMRGSLSQRKSSLSGISTERLVPRRAEAPRPPRRIGAPRGPPAGR